MDGVPIGASIKIAKQRFEAIPTFCSKCKARVTFKLINKEKSDFTTKCKCGCTVYKSHLKDEYHKTEFYTVIFIPVKKHIKDYKNKNVLERQGFKKKINKSNRQVYSFD